VKIITTLRFRLIGFTLGSCVLFFLLSFAVQSAFQTVRQADFSEQETIVERGCGKDTLSNLLFSKYNCGEGIVTEDSEGEALGGLTGKTEKIEGTSRGKVNTAESVSFLETTKEAARSKSPWWLAGLLLIGVFLYHYFNKRRFRILPLTETSINNRKIASLQPLSVHPTDKPKKSVPPQESVRLLLFDFNQQLPNLLQRRDYESVTEWTERINLSTPLAPYLITRYATEAERKELDADELHHFQQDLTTYLRQQSSDF